MSNSSRAVAGLALVFLLVLDDGRCQTSRGDTSPSRFQLDRVVLGYYPSWKKSEFDHTEIDYRFLTHIAEAFTKPDSDGHLVVDPEFIYPELVATAHASGVKVLMSIGGWGNCEGFPWMAATPETRTRFIGEAVEFCLNHHYDGVDIDWEFVSNPQEQADFVSFIKELSAALKSQAPPMLLSMAAPAGDFYGKWINYEELLADFDFISFMTYDFHGPWTDHSGHNSPLYSCDNDLDGSFDDSYLYARSRQIPNEKLLLGVPFYGHSFDCPGLHMPFKTSDDASYQEITMLRSQGWRYIWDRCAQVPYVQKPDRSEIICYDDVRSVLRKCQYVKEKQAAGIIIWELSQDYWRGKAELLEVIGAAFQRKR